MELVPFNSLLAKIIDNRGRTCPVVDMGIPLIATNCVKNTTLYPVFEKIRYVSPEIYKAWFRGHPESGDMVFVTKGSPGEVCWTPNPINFCIAQDMVALRADKRKVYPKYLFAALRSPSVKHDIDNMHVGTLIPHFKKGDFDKLYIPLPDRAVQEAIGDLYFALCQKIELNRQTNEILEELARAIFKDWFVDFGPTRAKAEGREPYLAPKLWDLFPDALDDEDKPMGWELGTLSDCIVLQRGFDLPTKQRRPGNYQVIAAGGSHGTHDEYMVAGPGVVTGRSGVIGNVFLTLKDFWPLNTTLWVKEFRRSSPGHAYFLLESIDLVGYGSGSAVPTLNRNHIHAEPLVLPPSGLVAAFSEYSDLMFSRMEHNARESETLAQIRDLLLPKLMSGELRLKDAERAVEEVT